tara:strand:- start:249 stop:1058 length:810 start_codon:yes stop_codon:yes gene_type:complete
MVAEGDIDTLLDDIYRIHGYDFLNYSRSSLIRRINRIYGMDKFPSFAELRYKVQTDPEYVVKFVQELTVNVTEMFRDPHFYHSLRNNVIPYLASKPFIRIWHAGCSTGEEVFSVAILLKEAGLLHKSLIYGTDINAKVLENIKKGVFPINHLKQYSENYIASGGKEDFSNYYTANYGQAKFKEELSKKIIISTHNLVSDGSFNEFDLILCRNVLIYFNKELQDCVLNLLDNSLASLGYLALGSKETLKFSVIAPQYRQLNSEKIWRKAT